MRGLLLKSLSAVVPRHLCSQLQADWCLSAFKRAVNPLPGFGKAAGCFPQMHGMLGAQMTALVKEQDVLMDPRGRM